MSYQQHTLAAALTTDGTTDLPVISGTITLDEAWAPYVQATIVCPMLNLAQLTALDPRQARRTVYLNASHIELPAGTNSSQITCDLMLRSRVIDQNEKTVTLTLASDEAALQDYRLMDLTPLIPDGNSLTITNLVNRVLARVGLTAATGPQDTPLIDPPTAIWKPGVTAWDYLLPLVQKAGLRLWCSEGRRWSLTAPSTDLVGSVSLYTDQTVTAVEESIDRDGDDWYDAVIVTYTWTNAAGLTQTAADTATQPGYSRSLLIEQDTPYPGPGAAAAILSRAIGRGKIITPTAVSNYDARPGMEFSIAGAASTPAVGIVAAVSWDFPSNEMTVKSRQLRDIFPYSWRSLAPGIAWSASPAGGSWANEPIPAP